MTLIGYTMMCEQAGRSSWCARRRRRRASRLRLGEAVEIIRALWAGGTVTYRGKHFNVESAKVTGTCRTPPPIRHRETWATSSELRMT
jgi:alkanesulfonate monooxygenase SsuD/methylene tetrahydromethanopterin reductase-like flavin-dependent oxidoreductase (luciferase family)